MQSSISNMLGLIPILYLYSCILCLAHLYMRHLWLAALEGDALAMQTQFREKPVRL